MFAECPDVVDHFVECCELCVVYPDAVSAAVVVALVGAGLYSGFFAGAFVLAGHESGECVCEGGVVVEVFGVVLIEAGADHGGFGFVELFVAFAHKAGAGFEEEAVFDELLDVRVQRGAGAGGELGDLSGGAFAQRTGGIEDFPADGIGERLHGLGVFDDEERDGLGWVGISHG